MHASRRLRRIYMLFYPYQLLLSANTLLYRSHSKRFCPQPALVRKRQTVAPVATQCHMARRVRPRPSQDRSPVTSARTLTLSKQAEPVRADGATLGSET